MHQLIYGKNPVLESLKNKRKIYELYVQENHDLSYLEPFLAPNIKIITLKKQAMQQKFAVGHQGIGALVEMYQDISLKEALKKPGLKTFIMLDSIEDPHNLGAIIRTADAFNVTGIIIPKHRSANVTPTVVKVSTGAIEYVDLIKVTNLNQAIETLKSANVWVVGTEMNTDKTLEDIHADTDVCIVFGSEGRGISRLVKENCDYTVKIPMYGHVNSLNVSVSCGIVLYDLMRRR